MPYIDSEIQEIFSEVKSVENGALDVLEQMGVGQSKKDKKEKALPMYSPIYPEAVEHAMHLSVHAEGIFPMEMFKKRAPNESPAEFDYRKSIYKPFTKPAWQRAQKTINRIWNRSNFKVEFEQSDSEDSPKGYFEESYPSYSNIYKYFESVVTTWVLKDPNAVLVVKPRRLPMKEDINGDRVIDQTQMVEPIALIYPSWQVMRYVEDEYVLILTTERVKLDDDGKGKKTGRVYEFYDDTNIWKLTQTGKKKDNNYILEVYYTHQIGELPCWGLCGIPVQKEEHSYKKSYFDGALPHLDQVVMDESTLQISKVAHAFPQLWVYVDPCPGEGCMSGYVRTTEYGKSIKRKCEICGGTGKVQKHSPLGTMEVQVPRANGVDDPDAFNSLSIPPAGYIEPSDTILEFNRKEIDRELQEAFVYINIDISNSHVKGSETALGKKIDRDEQFAFLLKISNELFGLLENTIRGIGVMRYNAAGQSAFEMPTITPPKNFHIRTEQELTEEISEAQSAKMDISAIKRLYKEYFMLRFHLDDKKDAIVNLIFAADRLIGKTDTEINSGIAVQKVAVWESILHDSIETFIEEFAMLDANFYERDIQVQKALLVQKAKDVSNEISGKKEDGSEKTDKELEAQAKLRGTVGGITGIVEITRAITEGTMTEEAAKLLLVDIYGFDDETATQIVEKPDAETMRKVAEHLRIVSGSKEGQGTGSIIDEANGE